MIQKGRNTLVAAAVAAVLGSSSTAMQAHAQESAQTGPRSIDEITVTARKRDESLLEIPVAITAFTRDDIVAADITGLDDVSDLTAGFQFFNQGNQQPGRYNTQLQFRGLTTAQFSPSFATGALFIDGVYVLNGGTSVSLMDIERIEVIKGPQSAYFGRNTFGGAVNMITRNPDMQEFRTDLGLSTSTRRTNEITAFVEGPIIQDRLAFSLGGRLYDKRGQYTATDGGRMGDEETKTINGVLVWEPTDALSFKVRYAYSEDDDGPPAQAFISGLVNDNCTGLTINTAEGPVSPQRYICGQVPDVNTTRTFTGGRVITSNTILPQAFVNAGINAPGTSLPGNPRVDDIGMRRDTERLSLTASYDFGDYNLTAITGRNSQGANWIRDLDLTDRIGWFSRDPQRLKDESYELRLTGPQDGRFRWLAGVNYYEQEFFSSGQGGTAGTGCLSFVSNVLTDDPATCLPFTLVFPNSLADADQAEVLGLFAAFDYDLTDELTVSVEARYQDDTFKKGGGLVREGQPVLKESFTDLLPRIILRYQPTDTTNLFVSYAEGQIAGEFNAFFINADERERAQYLAQDPNVSEALPAEKLEAWEFGWKQILLDGRAQFNLALYTNEWSNAKGRSSFVINETCRPSDFPTAGNAVPGCDPAIGQTVGDPKQILTPGGELIPFSNTRNILLPGDARIRGLEIETLLRPSDSFTLAASLTYIDSKYKDYEFNFVEPFAGFKQMAGNQTPRQPKWAGNIAMTKNFMVGGLEAYVRTDLSYQGKTFIDESNLAYIDDYALVHLRGGIVSENYRIELFVRNLLNEDAWATGSRWTDFSSPFQGAFFTAKQGVAVSPQNKREVGIRLGYSF